MKTKTRTQSKWLGGLALILLFTAFGSARAQNGAPQQPGNGPAQPQTNQADQMLGPLNLTPDQVQKIRTINSDLRDERQAANIRLRMAQRALAEAIQSPTPDETLIAQRSKEVADAQANTIRLRSLTEARVLQVLTPEQRVKLRELRQQNQARRNQSLRRDGNQQLPRILGGRQNGMQRNSNGNAPLNPRQQRKLTRPQQQKP